jgi:non-ribosomal peptide synthase protein (TIGR01720 family)
LTAVFGALVRWTGSPRQRIEIEGHGRETGRFPDVDLSRSVGWYTTLAPLAVDFLGLDTPDARVERVKYARASMPGRGLGWGVLRYLHAGRETRSFREAAPPEVSFNYLGVLDAGKGLPSSFRLADLPMGPTRSPRARRTHLLEIDAHVLGGILEVRLLGSPQAHTPETQERVAAWIVEELRSLLTHARAGDIGGLQAASDFPEAGLDAASLERLLSRLAGSRRGDRE